MPLSSSERGRLFREKRKNDKNYKEKEKERHKAYRTKVKTDVKKYTNMKKKTKLRVQKCRERIRSKKLNISLESLSSVYSSRSTKMKAVHKVRRSLPLSPRKQTAVIQEIAESLGLINSDSISKNANRSTSISESIEKKIQAFYVRDDISRMSPSIRDVKIIRFNGKKVKKQKRHLYFTLREVHSLFSSENPGIKISFSKFVQYRPEEVLLSRETPENICLCYIHENMIFLINSLSKSNSVTGIESYDSAWLDKIVIREHKECGIILCDSCIKRSIENLFSKVEVINNSAFTYNKWQKVDNQLSKSTVQTVIENALEDLKDTLPLFIRHCHTKRHQSTAYEVSKATALEDNSSCMVIQTDFAENYNCKTQDEIQSAYWGHKNISLFTCCVWSCEGIQSFIVVSDNTEHSKRTVCIFLTQILDSLELKSIKEINFWSDGPSCQYKNKYMFGFLPSLLTKYSLEKVTWNFFATSHGKGPVDGIGGIAKRTVTESVMRRSHCVQSAHQFSEVLKERESSIKVIVCNDIEEQMISLNLESMFANVQRVPDIQSSHYWSVSKTQSIKDNFTPIPGECEAPNVSCESPNESEVLDVPDEAPNDTSVSFNVGTYCIVNVEGQRGKFKKFLCQIAKIEGVEVEVQFYKPDTKKENNFVLNHGDKSWYNISELTKLDAIPSPAPRDHIQFHVDIFN